MSKSAAPPSLVCTALMRLGTRMAGIFDQHFAAMGVTQAQFRTLLAVCEEGGEAGITPSELAAHLLLDRATITLLSTRMVEQGWLERRPGANRRTFRLAVTPEGIVMLHRIIPRACALADVTLAHLPPTQLAQLEVMLTQIEDRIRDPDDIAEHRSEADKLAQTPPYTAVHEGKKP